MPAVIPFIPLIAAGIGGGAVVVGAKMQSNANRRAAETQSQAANYGADRELEGSREAERYQRQQAQAQWADAEGARRANFDQWAARQRSMNAFRKKYGFDETAIPDYVASQDPRFVQPEPDPADPTGFYRTFDRAAYQQYQQENPEAPLSPEEWQRQYAPDVAAARDARARPVPIPSNYEGPRPDSWRPQPRPRRPMGDVGSYLEPGTGFQPYGAGQQNPYGTPPIMGQRPMSVEDFLSSRAYRYGRRR